jgi:hypothetical protein
MDSETSALPEIVEPAAVHPEEMKASIDLAIGSRVRLRATARATPAGLVAVALMTSSFLAAAGWFLRSLPRQRG